MASLILQPCGDSDAAGHFVDTIENPISIDRIKSFLPDVEWQRLEPFFKGRESIPVWGVTPGSKGVNIKKWDRVETGDVAVFSRQGAIFASSTVVDKVHNKQLAIDLWETNAKGETWEYIYFLDELTYQAILYPEFNKAVGYAESYVIQGFNVLSPEKSEQAIASLNLLSERYISEIDEDDFKSAVSRQFEMAETDAEVKSTVRREQGYLRDQLFGNRVISTCCMCGEDYPVDLVITSHIKKRAQCSHEERLDYKNIVAPMCAAGCDAIFEKGYIVVSNGGLVQQGKKDIFADGLTKKINTVLGRTCASWNEATEVYFKWHRTKFLKTSTT